MEGSNYGHQPILPVGHLSHSSADMSNANFPGFESAPNGMHPNTSAAPAGPSTQSFTASPAAGPPSGHPPKKQSSHAAGGSVPPFSSKKGTKRPRPTLSCTECVRRKSKCDRCIPCSTCVKRGSPERCRVDDDENRPAQPFAQARELQAVRDRVSRLETLLLQIAPEQFKAIVGQVGQHSDLGVDSPSGGYNDSFGRGTPGSPHAGLPRVKRSESEMDMEDENEIGGDEEQAAIALESFAVGRGNPMSLEMGDTDMSILPLTSQARLRESQLRQQEIDFLMSMLPDWSLSRTLVDAFFNRVTWQNHVIHLPTFEAQYNAMRELVDQRRIGEIDPAWLSLYFMVLACGLFFSPSRLDMPASAQAECTNTWVLGAQRALTLADWSGKPQLTCIQSVVLFPFILMHAGGIKRLASWIAAALRMAQLLDLHKLDDKNRRNGSVANNFTPVEKEIGKRLYFSLAHGEVNFASRWLGLAATPHPHQHAIPHLLNVDDTDLLANPPISKSIEVPTASSYQVIRAKIMNQDLQARLTGSDARVHKYDSVLQFDRRTRELLDGLPSYWKYDRSDDPDIRAIVEARPYIAYQRCVILFGLNNRLLRAHRPFMARGYYDTKFAYSTDSCVKAAKIIIAAQRALRDIFDGADRMYNCLLYCFSSAVVLLVDNFHRLPSPQVNVETLDTQRHEALDVLAMLRREAVTSSIAQAGARVLEGLLIEEGQRRVKQGLPSASEDFTRNNTPDNEAPTLREVVSRLASVSNPVKQSASNTSGSPTLSAQNNGPAASPHDITFTKAIPSASSAPSQSTAGKVSNDLSPSAQQAQNQTDKPPSGLFEGVNADSLFSDSVIGGPIMTSDDSENLLRSLGLFEVHGGMIPSMGADPAGAGVVDGIFANMAGASTDLTWLDGLGEW